MIDVVVRRVVDEAQAIKSYELAPAADRPLPAFEAGAHVDVALGDGLVRSYSLIGPLGDPGLYRIAVALDAHSRGGSSHLHQSVAPGTRLRISAPRNHFALVEDAANSTLIAGGIGITPIWCMVQRLNQLKRPWQVHYACRTRAAAAFVPALTDAARAGQGHVSFWFDDEQGQPMDIAGIVRTASTDTHLYCCGPASMMGAFRDAAAAESSDRIHLEYFRPVENVAPRGAFEVVLAQSGRVVQVPAGSSILDALIMSGIDAPYSCYEGLCGTCETRVLEGIPDHRDSLLTEAAKASHKTIIICCSGSRSQRLVLDL